MKKVNKFFTGTVVGVIVLTIFSSWLYELFKAIPILNSIFSVFISLKNFVIAVLNFQIYVWMILVGLILIAFIMYIFKNLSIEKKPVYANYTEDIFKRWLWKWLYNDYWQPYQIEPYCPDCDVRLINNNIRSRSSSWESSARCPACGMEWASRESSYQTYQQKPETEYLDETTNLIEANINELAKAPLINKRN